MSPGTFLSPSGRLAPRPFAIAIIVVYLAGFASQMLLSQPVIGRAFVWPFVAAQAVLIWLWIVLHVRRLRDAGRSPWPAIAITIVYVLEIVLVVMMVWLLVASAGTSTPGADKFNILHLFILLYLFGLLAGDPSNAAIGLWLYGIVALLLLPIVVALCFSLWAATRPSVSAVP
jgi:uncharacterized membrane protein YhaH (DUF805 family)